MIRFLFISVSSFLLFLSCNNPFATTPGTQGKNIVPGLFLTGEGGGVYSTWGNPKSGGINIKSKNPEVSDEEGVEAPQFFSLRPLYPNPANGIMTIGVDFPRVSSVKIWMESAYLSLQEAESKKHQKFDLYDLELTKAGRYSFIMPKKNTCSGGELRQGFFRVFVQFEDQVRWQDIYIGGIREQAPPGLRAFNSVHTCSELDFKIN